MTSVLPSFRGKEATEYPHLHLKALPQVLKSYGYTTIFSPVYPDLSFDNTENFMKRLGFEHIETMAVSEADKSVVWGWGLQDDVFFARFFAALDRQKTRLEEQTSSGSTEARFFSVLATGSHHFPFDLMPADQRFLYPQPRTPREIFTNSLHLADCYLQEFFVQLHRRPYLNNSLVILVGDHSFPAGEHGLYYNEASYYEEFFRTPLLVLWTGHLTPRVIEDQVFSQLDVAPTVLDLLGIEETQHFLGRSIFQADSTDPIPLHLIQPYSGTYLCTVLYPFKYVKHLATNREFLYDLETDPLEAHNLVRQPVHAALLQRLRESQGAIFLNQKLIQENRIWPSSENRPYGE